MAQALTLWRPIGPQELDLVRLRWEGVAAAAG
jgi:hypothetical protein